MVGVCFGSDEASFTMYTLSLPWRSGYMHLNIWLGDITFAFPPMRFFTFHGEFGIFMSGLQDRLHELSGYGVCPTPEIFSGR